MKATRRTQPYRANQGARKPGLVLDAMLKGRGLHGNNPQDAPRAAQKRSNGRSHLARLIIRLRRV